MAATPNKGLIAGLSAAIIITTAITLYSLLTPVPMTFETFNGDRVTVSSIIVPLQGSCFTLTFNTATATLDGEPIQNGQQVCVWHEHFYEVNAGMVRPIIPVTVLTALPLFWLIALTPIFCLIALIQIALPGLFQPHPVPRQQFVGTAPALSGDPVSDAERGAGNEVKLTEIVLVTICFLVLVSLLWLPFGVQTNASRDNWEYRGWVEGGVFPMFNSPVSPQRPFTSVSEWIAYRIAPDSFLGYNVILIADLVLKGVLTWLLLRRLLPGQPVIAWGAGIVFALHPISPFATYALSVSQSVVLMLIPANLLLWYWRRPSVIVFGAAQITAMIAWANYESVLPLIALFPFLLLIDTPRLSRRWFAVAALWLVLPVFWMGYFVLWLTTSPAPYFVMNQGNAAGIDGTLRGIVQMYIRALPGAYLDAARALLRAIRAVDTRLLYGGVALVVSAVIGWRVVRRADPLPLRRVALLIACGLGAIFAGMVLYLPSSLFTVYVYDAVHPYYAATFGAALVIGGLLTFVPRRVQFAAVAAVAGVSVISLIGGHRAEQIASADNARSLAAIVEVLPDLAPGTTVLSLDESTGTRLNGALINASLVGGLRILYDDGSLNGRLCSNQPGSRYPCQFTPEGVEVAGYEIVRDAAPFDFYRGERELLPYDHLVIVRYDDQGMTLLTELPPEWGITTTAYRPLDYVDVTAPLPPRYESMLMPHAPFFRDEL